MKKKYVEKTRSISLTFASQFDNGIDPKIWIKELQKGIKELKAEGAIDIKVRNGYGAHPDHFVYKEIETDGEYKIRTSPKNRKHLKDEARYMRLRLKRICKKC